MNLQNYFYIFPEAIPHHFCDDIVNYGNSKGSELYDLAKEIQEQIVLNFEIELEFEVNVI